jgi:hypothetical protein
MLDAASALGVRGNSCHAWILGNTVSVRAGGEERIMSLLHGLINERFRCTGSRGCAWVSIVLGGRGMRVQAGAPNELIHDILVFRRCFID